MGNMFQNAIAGQNDAAGPDKPQEQQEDAIHDVAPGGLSMGNDLPSVAVIGGPPATFNGYSPDPSQDKLPAPGSSEGTTAPLSGIRR